MLSTFAFTERFELHHDTNSGRAGCGPTLQRYIKGGGCNHSDVSADSTSAADTLKLVLLQHM
jgi:hypothetical protein